MFDSSGEASPWRQLYNDALSHKLVGYDTLKEFEFICIALCFMSLLN
jgi:hypothetical protein